MKKSKVMNSKRVNAELADKDEKKLQNKKWEKPTVKDVSGKIMAQPYIRFT